MNIAFLGTTFYASEVLQTILKNPLINVILVVTPTDKRCDRKGQVILGEVAILAKQANISLLQTENINDHLEYLKSMNIQYILTCAFGQFIKKPILDSFTCINIHPSLLPKYRGGAPINWALINGEVRTGVSIIEMTPKMDAGLVFFQEVIPIESTDNFYSLEKKLIFLTCVKINSWLINIHELNYQPKLQNDTKATFGLNIKKEDLQINWSKTSEEIYNQIRGLNNIGAFTYYLRDGQRYLLKIFTSKICDTKESNANYGEVLQFSNGMFIIKTGDSALMALEIQVENKTKQEAKTFLNGFRGIKVGDVLV
ncbi:hypothetical protein ASO20_02840 [Mycoplasma sp. (ex Biomphalaria glabrata)]|uniref:methionyl-tRNA formyltransferase n=1 Tax=Mycoplasma sp. (ex Biomphalaria glabrata) TaxID=1749074 RepID=UPI00073A7FD4|nr:methionyl-tRNA formyltransferase [Mycoplasma sp. (ex Biomphalaria glabrata)]ALV23570.1 hypothetical protein ASO20_02840 [Mycoplasma sp. (ex Biomphalaria glabrata)]